jgi:hypothetical protein
MSVRDSVSNDLFRNARVRLFGSRQALAEAVNSLVPAAYLVTANDIGKIERGEVTWPRGPRREAFRRALRVADDRDIGFSDRRVQRPAGTVPLPDFVEDRDVRSSGPDPHHAVMVSPLGRPAGRQLPTAPAPAGGPAQSSADLFWRDVESTRYRSDTGKVIRRTVLFALAAAAGLPAVGAGRPSIDGERGPIVADVGHWQEAAWEYGYDYFLTPRERLLADICADQEAVRRQLAGYLVAGEVAAQPLAAVAARFTSLMALICTDLGYSREARHLWRFARTYADISDDSAVRLWVCGHEITSGIYQQRPLPVLAELARRAIERNPHSKPSAGKAELLGGQAQVLSLLGRAHEAKASLDELQATYERLPAATTNLRDSFFGWPEHRLHHATSFTYSMIGKTAKALVAQDSALQLYPERRKIGRCQINLHRARCLVIDGEVREGLSCASRAIGSVDSASRKEFVLVVADQVMEAVPRHERGRSDTREFDDLIRASRSVLS